MKSTPMIDRRISELEAEKAEYFKVKKRFRRTPLSELNAKISRLKLWKKEVEVS